MRPRVLLVENDPVRISVVKRRFRLGAVCVARNYADAVRSLRTSRYDLVLLDHDLDDRRHNGQDIAAFMATRLASRRRPEVLVHSTNPAGAFGIYLTLKRAGFDVQAHPFTGPCGGAPTRQRPVCPQRDGGAPRTGGPSGR